MNAKHLGFSVLLGFGSILPGCQSGYFDIREAVTPSDDLNQRLLRDVVTTIQANFLPAKTRFYFPHGQEKLAGALEGELRKYGYALSADLKSREKTDIHLAYKFSEIEKGLFILSVAVGEGFQFNRLYSETKDGEYVAAGPLLMRKG